MKKLLVALVLILCGCATTEITRVSSNAVVVKGPLADAAEAQALADAGCGRSGKTAALNQVVPIGGIGNFFFDCR